MTSLLRLNKNLIIELTLLGAAALSMAFGNINIYILILSILTHELGHIIAAFLTGAKSENFAIHSFGVEITFPGKTPTTNKLLFISSGGPFASLLLALAGFYLNNFMLFISNISITIVNLIPVYPLDGGNILYCLLSAYLPRKKLRKLMFILGKSLGIIISVCGILILFVSGFNISLIYMGLFIFFSANQSINPVIEIISTDSPKIEKSTLFTIDSSLSSLEAAGNLPANSIGAVKDKNGKILSFVTPLYLYNLSISEKEKNRL